MRNKLFVALLITATSLSAVEQSLKQYRAVRSSVEQWASTKLVGDMMLAYAEMTAPQERPEPACPVTQASDSSTSKDMLAQNDIRWSDELVPVDTVEFEIILDDVRAEAAKKVNSVVAKRGRRHDVKAARMQVFKRDASAVVCTTCQSDNATQARVQEPGDQLRVYVADSNIAAGFTAPVGLPPVASVINDDLPGDPHKYVMIVDRLAKDHLAETSTEIPVADFSSISLKLPASTQKPCAQRVLEINKDRARRLQWQKARENRKLRFAEMRMGNLVEITTK